MVTFPRNEFVLCLLVRCSLEGRCRARFMGEVNIDRGVIEISVSIDFSSGLSYRYRVLAECSNMVQIW